MDISGHWLTHVCVFEDQLTVPWRSLKCHSVAFSSCKKVRETISALTSTPWAMYPTNSCMRRVVCHSRPQTPTIAHQRSSNSCNLKWVSWCYKQCFDSKFPQVCSKPWSHLLSTVAKATHWVAKAWRGAWDKSGPLLKCTQLQYIIMIFESLMFLEVFHLFLMFLLKGVASGYRWWKKWWYTWSEKPTLKPTLIHSWTPPGIESITSI